MEDERLRKIDVSNLGQWAGYFDGKKWYEMEFPDNPQEDTDGIISFTAPDDWANKGL